MRFSVRWYDYQHSAGGGNVEPGLQTSDGAVRITRQEVRVMLNGDIIGIEAAIQYFGR